MQSLDKFLITWLSEKERPREGEREGWSRRRRRPQSVHSENQNGKWQMKREEERERENTEMKMPKMLWKSGTGREWAKRGGRGNQTACVDKGMQILFITPQQWNFEALYSVCCCFDYMYSTTPLPTSLPG